MLGVSNSVYNIKIEKYTANNKVVNLISFGQQSYGLEATPAHIYPHTIILTVSYLDKLV